MLITVFFILHDLSLYEKCQNFVLIRQLIRCINMQLTIRISKLNFFQICIIGQRTCISIFSKIGLVDLSTPCTQVYLQIFTNCINLQLAIRIKKNHAFRTCTTPSWTFMLILSSIGLLDNKLPRKEIISRRTDVWTDGQTDRRTARRIDGRTDVAHDNNR